MLGADAGRRVPVAAEAEPATPSAATAATAGIERRTFIVVCCSFSGTRNGSTRSLGGAVSEPGIRTPARIWMSAAAEGDERAGLAMEPAAGEGAPKPLDRVSHESLGPFPDVLNVGRSLLVAAAVGALDFPEAVAFVEVLRTVVRDKRPQAQPVRSLALREV